MGLPVHLVNRILTTTRVLNDLDKLSEEFLKIPDQMSIRHKESVRRLTGSTGLRVLMSYDNWLSLLNGLLTILNSIPTYYPDLRQDIKNKYVNCLNIFCEEVNKCQQHAF